jgi:S1-C subfamily serine protease
MPRSVVTVFAAVLLPLLSGACAPAQAQRAVSAGAVAQEPPRGAARGMHSAYTGLDILLSARATAGPNPVVTAGYPRVRAVYPNSPAHQAGVVAGDVIVEVDGRDSRDTGALWLQPGVRYTLRIRRGEEEREVAFVPLPPRPRPSAPAP